MKKDKGAKYLLGDLIAALFDEAGRVCPRRVERKVMVYAALKHILRTEVSTKHRIALKA